MRILSADFVISLPVILAHGRMEDLPIMVARRSDVIMSIMELVDMARFRRHLLDIIMQLLHLSFFRVAVLVVVVTKSSVVGMDTPADQGLLALRSPICALLFHRISNIVLVAKPI
eukprot:TRINITY_DN682_c0_g2_i1.p2 TRINITY_DN682_c0_g2~~TRINITY_DN682_c0_g2_i1.p2  ORF type:complete len:115 (+),score=13.20 TRINITY_DN682_c0_g2_i1:669-1013(+)